MITSFWEKAHRIALGISIACVVGSSWLAVGAWRLSDAALLDVLASVAGLGDRRADLAAYLPASRLFGVRMLLSALPPLLLMLSFIFYFLRHSIPSFCQMLGREFWQLAALAIQPFTDLPASQKRLAYWVFALLILFRVVLFTAYPVHIDEAFSYTYLVSKGLIVSFSYYPGPNNHIGYTLFPALLAHLPADPLLVMRLPAFCFGLALLGGLFLALLRPFGFGLALAAIWGFGISLPGLYFSVVGRGYGLAVGLFLVGFFALFYLLKKENWLLWVVWVVANAWAVFTVPIMLIPLATSAIWAGGEWLFNRNNNFHFIQKLIKSLAAIGLLAGLLYLPALLLNGWRALVANQWVASQPLGYEARFWWEYWRGVHANSFEIWPWGYWLVWVGLGVVLADLFFRYISLDRPVACGTQATVFAQCWSVCHRPRRLKWIYLLFFSFLTGKIKKHAWETPPPAACGTQAAMFAGSWSVCQRPRGGMEANKYPIPETWPTNPLDRWLLWVFFVPVVWLLIQQVQPPARVWLYLAAASWGLLARAVQIAIGWASAWGQKAVVIAKGAVFLLLLSFSAYTLADQAHWVWHILRPADRIPAWVAKMAEKAPATVWVDDPDALVRLQFEVRRKGAALRIGQPSEGQPLPDFWVKKVGEPPSALPDTTTHRLLEKGLGMELWEREK